MPREIDQFRRRFLGSAAMTLAAGRLGLFDIAHAQSGITIGNEDNLLVIQSASDQYRHRPPA